MEEDKTVEELTNYFSDISRNSGKISFRINYTATPGNVRIHKDFQKFAFEEANNEYLAAIGLLLALAKHNYEMAKIEECIVRLEKRIEFLEDHINNVHSDEHEFKTF